MRTAWLDLRASCVEHCGEMAVSEDGERPKQGADVVAAERARRLGKLEDLERRGIAPYPVRFDRDHAVGEVREEFGGLESGQETDRAVALAGRVMLIRRHGGLIFADLSDQTGTIQLVASRDGLGAEAFADVRALDRGDWVGVGGTVMTTRAGELSVRVTELQLLSKALRALPDKHRGLTDVDTRLRQRYLDLIVNPESRRVFDVPPAGVSTRRPAPTPPGLTPVGAPGPDPRAAGGEAPPAPRRGGAPPPAPAPPPPHRAGRHLLPPPRPRPAPHASGGGARGGGLRTRPLLPQGGPPHPPQPRVHAARGLPGPG